MRKKNNSQLKLFSLKHLSETNKNVLFNVFGAFFVKGMALVVSLLTMPIYMVFFNNEVALGLWFTILSVLSWILNFDLGIGNGLRNKITITLSKDDSLETKRYLSSAYISIGILCIVMTFVFISVSSFVNWNVIFNIKENIVSKEALLITIRIVFVGIVLQLFFKLITSVLYALQKSSINNLLSLITSVVTLICVIIIPSGNNDENIIRMAFVNVFAVISPLLLTTYILFSKNKLKKSRPSISFFHISHTKEVLSLGGYFLFVQFTYMMIMSTNEFLITSFCGNQYVTEYQIYYRPFSIGSIVFTLAMTPIWSAVTKAFAENNINWIIKLNKFLFKFSIIGAFMVFLLIPFLQTFVNIWLGKNTINIDYGYAFSFAFLGSLMILNSYLSSISNGLGKLKIQSLCFGIGAIIKIPLAWLLVNITASWIGVVWANVLSICFYCIIQPIVLNTHLKTINITK